MPELPEVEIIGRNLKRWMSGRRIEAVEPLRESAFQDGTLERALEVVGHRVTAITRRGKALWMETSGPVGWLMRFGMTGKWVLEGEGGPPPWTRVRVQLEGAPPVCFVDMRSFGGIWGVSRELGPAMLEAWVSGRDPLLEGLSGEVLEQCFRGRKAPVKVLLLEQGLVAGVGNIYASEALYRAGIHPHTPAGRLDAAACARLAEAIVAVLTWAIEAEERDEVKYLGEAGAENIFSVYRREGSACGRCGVSIERVVIAARSSYFCPACQPEGR